MQRRAGRGNKQNQMRQGSVSRSKCRVQQGGCGCERRPRRPRARENKHTCSQRGRRVRRHVLAARAQPCVPIRSGHLVRWCVGPLGRGVWALPRAAEAVALPACLVAPPHLEQVLQHRLLRDLLRGAGRKGRGVCGELRGGLAVACPPPSSAAAVAAGTARAPNSAACARHSTAGTSHNMAGTAQQAKRSRHGRHSRRGSHPPPSSSGRTPPWQCPPCCWWGAPLAPQTASCTCAASEPAGE